MNFDTLKIHLSSQAAVTVDTPFGPDALVYKVGGKMFAILGWMCDPMRITLKCDPLLVSFLRETYPAVQPGYYMDKRHWNTVNIDGSVPDDEFLNMIAMSYDLVVRKLSRRVRVDIGV